MTAPAARSPHPAFTAISALAADIKLAHSIFALPFAVLAAFMAATHGGPVDWTTFAGQLVLIVIAMFLARTVAMLANRLLDRNIDRDNPRTAGRALPSGRVSTAGALLTLGVGAVLFVVVCAGFGVFYDNWWPVALSVPVLGWISVYGVLKRFTVACHLYLGSALAVSPIAAAIAIDPSALSQPALWMLAAMVLGWVAGFDIIYALQDIEVDRAQGLHSIPGRFGLRGGLWISRALHVAALGCLVVAWIVDVRLGLFFAVGTGIVAALLLVEHATVARWGRRRIALAFFTLNGIISCVLGGLGIADLIV